MPWGDGRMKSWYLSLILLLGSLAVTVVLWLFGPAVLLCFPVYPAHPPVVASPDDPALPGMRMGNHRRRALLSLGCDSPLRRGQ